jgi:uncharacterized membrane protein
MILAFNDRNAFISFLSVILLFSALIILIVPLPSFADRIIVVRQGATLDVGCDLSNNDDFIDTTKVLTYDQPTKLTFNCERPGGDVDLKKAERITLQCLHDSPLTIPKHAKMKAGELFYVICNVNRSSD